jgi:hypothetical protein
MPPGSEGLAKVIGQKEDSHPGIAWTAPLSGVESDPRFRYPFDPMSTPKAQPTPKKKKNALQEMAGTVATAIVIMIVLSIFVFPMFNRPKEGKIIGQEIEELGKAMETYQSEFGSLPSGNHREIWRALRGENPSKKVFTTLDREDDNGRLLDPWNQPYQFYVSSDGFVIRSAGPDKTFDHGTGIDADDFFYGSK